MNKFGFGTIAASGLVAAILGLSAPAQAAVSAGDAPTALASVTDTPTGIDHHTWLDDIRPHVNVPHVDTGVHQSPQVDISVHQSR